MASITATEPAPQAGPQDGSRRGPFSLLRAVSRPSLIALAVAIASIVSGAVTYLTLAGLAPYAPTPSVMIALVLIDITLVLALAGLIAWRLARLWTQRRIGAAGARLHLRLVAMFSAIAVVPAILVAIFAAVSLNLGVEAWFSDHVKTALDNSVRVADAYVNEHKQVIRGDVLAMAFDLNRAGPQLLDDPQKFKDYLVTQAAIRALPAVYVVDHTGRVLASAKLPTISDQGTVTPSQVVQADTGKVVILTDTGENVVSALVKLDVFRDAYLLVSRTVDPVVLEHQRNTNEAVSEYRRLSQSRADIQLTFAALYVLVSLLILLAAVWLALWAANRIVTPIGRLAGAAERVREGDLSVRVAVRKDDDEIASLSQAFNRMTSQLEGQRKELIETNEQLDARRRFTETMLAGVSAGVIGLNSDGEITLVNRATARLLNSTPEEIEGRHYSEAVPELAGLIRRAMIEGPGRASGQADLKRTGSVRHLNVQVRSEAGEADHGFVVTFDDITDLVSAQRTAAWAEVARRIAHEIKNPLTPIQLSAERLKRKYADEVTTDPEIFAQCVDTIVRQVGDIGRMVDEFSSFARMPAPSLKLEHIQELVRQAAFLQRVANPLIAFDVKAPNEAITCECDGRLMSQALTNVLKNAVEAIGTRQAAGDDTPGRIDVDVTREDGIVAIAVRDNGTGLPKEHRHRLTEPYVTTRAKGTGLGLAIVRKILEDHSGSLILEDADDEAGNGDGPGATVRMILPLRQPQKKKGSEHEQERVVGRV